MKSKREEETEGGWDVEVVDAVGGRVGFVCDDEVVVKWSKLKVGGEEGGGREGEDEGGGEDVGGRGWK